MKRLICAILMLIPSFSALGGGATGGFGLVLEDNQELSMKYIGEFENLSLLKASKKTFRAIESARDPNVTLRLQDRVVTGRILEPEFADAVSIETEEGGNVVILNEAALSEEAAESTGN